MIHFTFSSYQRNSYEIKFSIKRNGLDIGLIRRFIDEFVQQQCPTGWCWEHGINSGSRYGRSAK
jgi:hypothetical protein